MGFFEQSVQTDAPTRGGVVRAHMGEIPPFAGTRPGPLENLKVLGDRSGRKLEFETTGTRSSYKELAPNSQGVLLQPKTFIAPTLNG